MSVWKEHYKQKQIIRRQKRSISDIFNHLKHPERPISDEELINYSFHLSAIAELTVEGKIARAANKCLEITQRFINHRKLNRGQLKKVKNYWNNGLGTVRQTNKTNKGCRTGK